MNKLNETKANSIGKISKRKPGRPSTNEHVVYGNLFESEGAFWANEIWSSLNQSKKTKALQDDKSPENGAIFRERMVQLTANDFVIEVIDRVKRNDYQFFADFAESVRRRVSGQATKKGSHVLPGLPAKPTEAYFRAYIWGITAKDRDHEFTLKELREGPKWPIYSESDKPPVDKTIQRWILKYKVKMEKYGL
jgi:hypothetical protein